MKISYNWLKQFLKINLEAKKTGKLLTNLGLEVEGIETVESIKGSLSGVVVGEVLTCKKHPNADKLKLTTVDIGAKDSVQIICGAPNIATGQKVPVAKIGTTLYSNKGEPFKIKKEKIRGEISVGMICSESELGIGKKNKEILVLSNTLVPSTPVKEVFNIKTDEVFEIGLTPNRADAMSHYGVARDLRAGLMQQGIDLKLTPPLINNLTPSEEVLKIDVSIKDKKLTPRYCGITIKNIEVEESPEWLQTKLKAIGLSPINNIVDITNYVLHEFGQPLHAFDAEKIKGNGIIVKQLKEGTKFTTLDGVERKLHKEDLMICDKESNPLCIAGVLGGKDSGVSENTNSIFLESAYFSPVSIRKSAKRHSLNTDASFRFERGIDPNLTKHSLKRAANLITEIAGGKISSDIIDVYPKKFEDFKLNVSYKTISELIGKKLPNETIKNILTSLEIKINNESENGLSLTIPYYRVDIRREADVIEEILRIYGYNNIQASDRLNTHIPSSSFNEIELENIIGNQLNALGFSEIMSNSLSKKNYISDSKNLKKENNVILLNPLSIDLSVMRQSMLFSGLESISYNINRKNNILKFFEFGKTYHKKTNYEERKHLALFVYGNKTKSNWTTTNNTFKQGNFFYLKGVIISLLQRLGVKHLKTTPAKNDIFREGIKLSSEEIELVNIGIIKESILKDFRIKQEIIYADFNWDNSLEISRKRKIKVESLSKFPSVKRDLSLLLKNEEVTFDKIYNLAFETEKKFLKEADLFDVYKGNKLGVSFLIQDEEKTLNNEKVNKIMEKLQIAFIKIGAIIEEVN